MFITENHQTANRSEWLLDRHGRITGTKAAALTLEKYAPKPTKTLEAKLAKARDLAAESPDDATLAEEVKTLEGQLADVALANSRYKVPKDFWALVGERLGEPITDGLRPMERGTFLEPFNIEKTLARLGIDPETCELDPAMWVDDSLALAVSPDAHEKSDTPSWAIECKSLGFAEHVKAVASFLYKKQEDFPAELFPVLHDVVGVDDPLAGVPVQYRAQVLQYFVVNPDLQVLYFSLYLPELGERLGHVVVPLERDRVAGLVAVQRAALEDSVRLADRVGGLLLAALG